MLVLEPEIADKIFKAENENFVPSAEQQLKFTALNVSASSEGDSRIMSLAGETAQINIEGALSKKPNILAMIFGGGNVTYSEILTALSSAESDESVINVVLAIDSPGGDLDGMFEAMDAIRSFSKPIKAVVQGKALSAAYGLASQADEIVAVNEASTVGSIGVLAQVSLNDTVVNISSTKAPNKAPDVRTAEGQKIVRDHLDDLHDIFVTAIARGRSVAPNTVNKDFGRGGTLVAKDALRLGMVDSISNPITKTNDGPVILDGNKKAKSNNGVVYAFEDENVLAGNFLSSSKSSLKTKKNKGSEDIRMNLEDLKAEHPVLCAEIKAAGNKEGVAQERDRVQAHLILGESSGDMATALKAVEEGTELTASINAKYLGASMNKQDLITRAADNTGAGDHSASGDGADDAGTDIAGRVEALAGDRPLATK